MLPKNYDFPWPPEQSGCEEIVRDADGTIESALQPVGPCAVLLRTDRHVFAVIPLADPQPVVQELQRLVSLTRC